MMYQELLKALVKPALYEKTDTLFWNDPHIAKSMLEAHLNPELEAVSRKPETIDKAVDFIETLVSKEAKILDIGCGPGLYTKRLSDKGFNVTGLDFSDNSIAYAKAHDTQTTYLVQDYLEMDFENEFDLITFIYCDYGALVPEDREKILKNSYRALKSGGQLLFDVFTKSSVMSQAKSREIDISDGLGFWSGHPYIALHGHFIYDEGVIGDRYAIYEANQNRIFNIWTVGFSESQLSDEVENTGFKVMQTFGGIENRPFDENGELLAMLVEK